MGPLGTIPSFRIGFLGSYRTESLHILDEFAKCPVRSSRHPTRVIDRHIPERSYVPARWF